jgi:hypothetical protein
MNCLTRFFKKPIVIDLEQIYKLQVDGDFESVFKILNNNKLNKSQIAEDYCIYLLKRYNGTFQRTQYGPLLVNREVIHYYNEFITKMLLK